MKAYLRDGRIVIETTYDERSKASGIPGARWNALARAWTVPASPAYAGRVADAGAEIDDGELLKLRSWLDVRKAGLHVGKTEELPPDYLAELKTKPWQHQEGAILFGQVSDACMFHMHMGTGKTKVTIDIATLRGHQRVLVLCPKAVIRVWEKEIAKHAAIPMRALALSKGSVKARSKTLSCALDAKDERPLIVIVNYEAAWHKGLAEIILRTDWDCVVFDESTKIKSATGKASRFCAKIPAPHRLALTGTPMPHSPMDIFGQYRALDPGIFGLSYTRFKGEYAIMGGYQNHQVVNYRNMDDMRARIDTIRYEVKSDALDLPPIQTIDVPVVLEPKTLKHYMEMENLFITNVLDGAVTASNALAKLLRLQQITCGFLPLDDKCEQIGTEKADALSELIEEAGGEPIVVFCRFRNDLKTIERVTQKLKLRYGEVSGLRKELDDWDADKVDILGVQIQAGGMGIDLTRARYAVYFSLGYSLGDYDQSVARLHRPGQEKPVTIYRLVGEKTIDEKIVKALDSKRAIVESVLGDINAGHERK